MNSLLFRKSLVLLILTSLSACQLLDNWWSLRVTVPENILQHSNITSIPEDSDNFWNTDFDHKTDKRLLDVSYAIIKLAREGDIRSQQLDHLLYYIRAYSYFGPWPEEGDKAWIALDAALHALANMSGFFTQQEVALRLQEHYLVSCYRYLYKKALSARLDSHSGNLVRIINGFNHQLMPDSIQGQYTLWEALRSSSFLAHSSNKYHYVRAGYKHHDKVREALFVYLSRYLPKVQTSDWVIEHSLWSLARYQHLQDDDLGKKFDKRIMALLSSSQLDKQVQKKLFTQRYLVNSFRAKSSCQKDFKDFCLLPPINEALLIEHKCSDSILIRANDITPQQLADTCTRLTSQEDDFHQKLATDRVPVANDFNETLEVVVFDNYGQYNLYAATEFDINTNNGGMYLEGTPSAPDNTARFLAFETEWIRPEFGVWNLNHEYAHYIDGRFVAYGDFEHYEKNIVWWSEGLATYIAEKNDYKRAFEVIRVKEPDKWYTLAEIFATDYSHGGRRIYRWSYLAIRFLNERHVDDFRKLAHFLKTDYFKGYRDKLESIGKDYQQEFQDWLITLKGQQQKEEETESDKPIHRYLYYELYRHYLQKISMPLTKEHMHNVYQ